MRNTFFNLFETLFFWIIKSACSAENVAFGKNFKTLRAVFNALQKEDMRFLRFRRAKYLLDLGCKFTPSCFAHNFV